MSRTRRAQWFAVDTEGYVGRFLGDAGASIPKRALVRARGPRLAEAIDVARVVRWLLEPHDEPVRPSALLPDRMLVVFRDEGRADPGYRDPAHVDPVPARLAGLEARVLRARAPLVVMTGRDVDVETVMALAKSPDVLHLLGLRDVEGLASQLTPGDALYAYRHDAEAHEDGIYARGARAPAEPIHESEIPLPERTALLALRIPVSFGASESFDVRGLAAERLPKEGGEEQELRPAPVGRFVGGPAWLVMSVCLAVLLRALFVLFHR